MFEILCTVTPQNLPGPNNVTSAAAVAFNWFSSEVVETESAQPAKKCPVLAQGHAQMLDTVELVNVHQGSWV